MKFKRVLKCDNWLNLLKKKKKTVQGNGFTTWFGNCREWLFDDRNRFLNARHPFLGISQVDEDDESGHQRFSTKTGDPNRSTRTVAATDATERDPERGYGYGYAVRDEHAGTDFSQWERREPGGTGTVTGQYRVQLPDGRTQTVTYTADPDTGYRASVTYQGVPRYPDSKPRSSAPARRSARKTIKSVAPAPNLPHDN